MSRCFLCFFWGLCMISVVVTTGGASAAPPRLPESSPRLTPEVRAVHRVLPAVVNIATEKLVSVSDPFQAFFQDYFEAPVRYYRKSIPLGSGVVVDRQGLVLTNLHVVRRASNIEVHFLNGEKHPATLAAYNERNDLALLRVRETADNKRFSEVNFAKPDDLLLGETVIAVGNPFGLEHTVTSGVLSARNRSLKEGDVVFTDILQTDAAINPGNSGGPLINLDGYLIGLNLAIRAGAEGIGFAIPLRRIEEVLAKWLLPSHFSSGTCGFVPGTKNIEGKLVAVAETVDADSPAADVGLAPGTVIAGVNGKRVHRSLDVSRILWTLEPGDVCRLELESGTVLEIPVRVMNSSQLIRRRLGLHTQLLTPALGKALGLDQVEGLVVSDVDPDGAFGQSDIQRGDVLYGLGRVRIESHDELGRLLRNLVPGEPVDVHFLTSRKLYGQVLLQRRTVRVTLQ
jgi:serine protease Do